MADTNLSENETELIETINPAYFKDWYRNHKYASKCKQCGYTVVGAPESIDVAVLKTCPACGRTIKRRGDNG